MADTSMESWGEDEVVRVSKELTMIRFHFDNTSAQYSYSISLVSPAPSSKADAEDGEEKEQQGEVVHAAAIVPPKTKTSIELLLSHADYLAGAVVQKRAFKIIQ